MHNPGHSVGMHPWQCAVEEVERQGQATPQLQVQKYPAAIALTCLAASCKKTALHAPGLPPADRGNTCGSLRCVSSARMRSLRLSPSLYSTASACSLTLHTAITQGKVSHIARDPTCRKLASCSGIHTRPLRHAAVVCPMAHPLAALAALPETSNRLSTPVAALFTPSSTTVNVFFNLQAGVKIHQRVLSYTGWQARSGGFSAVRNGCAIALWFNHAV